MGTTSSIKTPSDLQDALLNAKLADFFADCTPAHRREYMKWIDEAKRPETRRDRIAKTVDMIGKKQAQESARGKKPKL